MDTPMLSRRGFTAAALAFPLIANGSTRSGSPSSPAGLSGAIGPVLTGLYADPHIVRFGDRYYIYPTTDGQRWMSTSFKCFSSSDLVNWKDEGVILDLAEVAWAETKAWAPAAARGPDGRYYFYFTAQDRIGVAVSDSPTGPFRDALGKPLIERNQFETYPIDPMVFADDDGERYLYFGNGRCIAVRLKPNMIEIDEPTARDITPESPTTEYREGAFMLRRGDTYHLSWSVNDTRSPDYQVHAATSDALSAGTPTSPPTCAQVMPRHAYVSSKAFLTDAKSG